MLGSFRLLLALMVVARHLGGDIPFFSQMGPFAVFGFYVISGYLITLILHEVYHFNCLSFWTNRVLRLFPMYYGVALISLLYFLYQPLSASAYHPSWSVVPNIADWLGNLLIVPFGFSGPAATYRLVPPTWSIGVELINYFILWVIVARSALMTGLTLAGSLAFHIVSLKLGQSWSLRHFPFYAALLPFASGAAIYFIRKAVPVRSVVLLTFTGLVWLVNVLLCGALGGIGGSYFDGFYYFNWIALTLFVFSLASLSFDSFKAVDRWIGDLAYPIFLVHWLVGYLIASSILPGQGLGLELLAYSLPVILLVSMGLASMTRRYLEPVRDRIRFRITNSSEAERTYVLPTPTH